LDGRKLVELQEKIKEKLKPKDFKEFKAIEAQLWLVSISFQSYL